MSVSKSYTTDKPGIAEFRTILLELSTVSNSCIQALTTLAANNICEASVIVGIIETRLQAAHPEVILPILHVVDAIMKHVGKEYIPLFSVKLIKLLASIFPRLTDDHKLKMFELRKTWGNLIHKTILFHLDVRLNAIHPCWVVKTDVYVNSAFFTTQKSDLVEPEAQDVDVTVDFLERQLMSINRELKETYRMIQEEENKDSKVCRFIPSPSSWSSPRSHSLRSYGTSLNASLNSDSTASDPSQVSEMSELPESSACDENAVVDSTENKNGKPPFEPRPLNSQKIDRRPRSRSSYNSSRSPTPNPKKTRIDEDSDMQDKPMEFLDVQTLSDSYKDVDHRRLSIMESVMGKDLGSARRAEPVHVTNLPLQSSQYVNRPIETLLVNAEKTPHLFPGPMTLRPERPFQDAGNRMSYIEVPPPDPALLKLIDEDPTDAIYIDDVLQEVRFYGDTAVVFRRPNSPEEIRFEDGTHQLILINNYQVYQLHYNKPCVTISAGGIRCNVRLGSPTRELYVDGMFYRMMIGGFPISVKVENSVLEFSLLGRKPSVSLGPLRKDLVAGKITILIDGKDLRPIYLDAKPQKYYVDGVPFILQFVNDLRAILVNGVPIEVGFGPGSKPVSVSFGGMRHHFTFSALPEGVIPGSADIRRMSNGFKWVGEFISRSELLPPLVPWNVERPHPTPYVGPSFFGSDTRLPSDYAIPSGYSSPRPEIVTWPGPLNPMPASSTSSGPMGHPGSQFIDQRMSPGGSSSQTSTSTPVVGSGVSDLSEKLQDADLVPLDERFLGVRFDDAASLRTKRQTDLLNQLYSGVKCSQCSMRFTQTEGSVRLKQKDQYGEHLDFHFRENHRMKENCHRETRPFYMTVSDWKDFREIESKADRPLSLFELQALAQSRRSPDITCSAPVGDREMEVSCEVCGDVFEQFFCNDEEEWRLKDAVENEGKLYHPICFSELPKPEPISGNFPRQFSSLDSNNDVREVIPIDDDVDTEDTAAPCQPLDDNPKSWADLEARCRIDESLFRKFSWLKRNK